MKTLKQCQKEVAIKYGLGKSLVTGHRVTHFDEAAEMYAQQYKDAMQKQKLKASE